MIRGVSSHLELCHYNTIRSQSSQNNAWNVNTNSSNCNTNNNNKNNNLTVRAFSDYLDNDDFLLFASSMLAAYYECRRNKRGSISEILYEMNGVSNTMDLAYDIYTYNYEVSVSICFLIYIPTLREVFAASFRDRIVHTWIAMRIEPSLERYLPDCTYSNRKGRGTSGAIKALKKIIDEHPNYYIWKFDLQGFFMSIDKRILWSEFEPFIKREYNYKDKDLLIYVTKIALFNAPQDNCIRMCSADNWNPLPKKKSLFGNPWWLGLPIGDLLSQMMVGFFLKPFIDKMRSMGFVLNAHYVDDFTTSHESKEHILESIPVIREWLLENRGLTLHPKKFYLQHASKGVRFLGAVIKPNRIYAGERTTINAFNTPLPRSVRKALPRINSYLGYFKQYMTYALREKLAERCFKYKGKVYFDKSYGKMIIKGAKKKKKKKHKRK